MKALFQLFFPNRCRNCQRILQNKDEILCVKCTSNLPFTYWRMDKENVIFEKVNNLTAIDSACALFHFQKGTAVQRLLHQMKFYNQPNIGKQLALLAFEELKHNNFDLIIPVPTHRKKLRKRGYNQITQFAKTLANELDTNYNERILIRTTQTKSQIQRDRKHRLNALQNAFELTNSEIIKGKRILLVDDLCTTGATLSTCCNTLKQVDKTQVSVYVIASSDLT